MNPARFAPPAYTICAMMVFQAGAAVSLPLLRAIGPIPTTWLRLLGATAVLWVVARPRFRGRSPGALVLAGLLGVATWCMSALYAAAIARIPLGVANAIEFTGPLAVAIASSRRGLDAGWAVLAAVGVCLLTLARFGWSTDPPGIALALGAAACWAAYILLTKRVAHAFPGLQGLTLSLTTAAIVAAPLAAWGLRGGAIRWEVAAAAGLGLIVPVLPYAIEVMALRRMSTRAFGILMSVEPAVAAAAGALLLGQVLEARQLAGIVCVVLASVGAVATAPRAVARDQSP